MKKCPYKNFEDCIGSECAAAIENNQIVFDNNVEKIVHTEYCYLTSYTFLKTEIDEEDANE